MDDILEEIKIPLNFRIVKPSKNTDLHNKLQQKIFENLSDGSKQSYLEKTKEKGKKIRKGRAISEIKKFENCYKKDYLRRKNQGNKLS